jgi:hypothetical protein
VLPGQRGREGVGQGVIVPGVHGFSATTLPLHQKESGVPCMRAVLRATCAERRRARPAGVKVRRERPECLGAFLVSIRHGLRWELS